MKLIKINLYESCDCGYELVEEHLIGEYIPYKATLKDVERHFAKEIDLYDKTEVEVIDCGSRNIYEYRKDSDKWVHIVKGFIKINM